MKKILSIICVAILAFTASSCKKEIQQQIVNTNTTRYYTINPSDWALTADGKYYSYTKAIPALDDTYNENGAVLVYLAKDQGGEWEPVPETFDGTAFSFTHKVGSVSIFSQTATGTGPVKPTSVYDVKVVMIDSNIN